MIQAGDLLNFNVYKKEPLTGSDRGMRYMLRKEEIELPILNEQGEAVLDEEGNPSVDKKLVLAVYVWPEPFAFDYTEEALKTRTEFEFSKNGQMQALDWLNEMRTSREEYWEDHVGIQKV